eukprot:TRINITY_DN12290_c0_g2_i1.p1 TRINITY_DN12290_c0_g2~~TRINITY_DN12290_c0_g2_i1.p1  ORF type:complete len:240 (+),score=41.78 TRINITY_DN12290_c0_g2_i1:36-755(+)
MGKGFVIGATLSIVNTVLVVVALSAVDGLMVLKSGDNKLKDTSTSFRDIEGIGGSYGIGLIQDTFGRGWDDGRSYYHYTEDELVRHPSHIFLLLGCNIHKTRGTLAMSGCILSVISLTFSAFATLSGHFSNRRRNIMCILLQAFSVLFLIMSVASASSVYNEQFLCESLHLRVRFNDYFELGYVIPVLGFCTAISLATVIILLCSDNSVIPTDANSDNASEIPLEGDGDDYQETDQDQY